MTSGDRVIARDRVIPPLPGQNRRGSGAPVIGKAKLFFDLIRAVLREIFEESAYDRFLRRTNATRTRQSYNAFLREQETAGQEPRCC